MNDGTGNHSDSDDTLTSSDLSDVSDYEGDREDDDYCDTESCRSLAFSVKSNKSTASVKSSKSKKRVRFKPGDSLVLVYVIPNREMLGLHSASESSDSEYSASDSDDENDDGNDQSDDEKDDNDDDSEDNDDSDDDDDGEEDDDSDDEDIDNEEHGKFKSEARKTLLNAKPIGRLVSVRKVNMRKPIEFPKPLQKVQEPVQKLVGLDTMTAKQKKRSRKSNKTREKKDKGKKENSKTLDKPKKEKGKRLKNGAIKVDIDKIKSTKRNRSKSRLLEIKATVDTNHKTNVSVPKLVYKHDFKPSVIDVNGSNLSGNSGKQLMHRSKLQPTSIRLSKKGDHSNTLPKLNGVASNTDKSRRPATVLSATYDSLSSVVPSSYVSLHQALTNDNRTVEESLQRLDPNDMNASNKRLYAWQVANGNITSQSLRTPSILPFLDSLKTSVVENGAVDVPS